MNNLNKLFNILKELENLVLERGLISPTQPALERAKYILQKINGDGVLPTRIVPNGEGGIVFELNEENASVNLEIFDDGNSQTRVFINCKMSIKIDWQKDSGVPNSVKIFNPGANFDGGGGSDGNGGSLELEKDKLFDFFEEFGFFSKK